MSPIFVVAGLAHPTAIVSAIGVAASVNLARSSRHHIIHILPFVVYYFLSSTVTVEELLD
jgi:hypothetical protein